LTIDDFLLGHYLVSLAFYCRLTAGWQMGDRAAGVRLKVKDERSSIKNRSEQSIYPTQKSVLKTEATPHSGSESGDPECNAGSQKCECHDRCQGDEPSGHGILHHRQTFFIAQKRNQMFTHIYPSYR
jgi:hypothetical protein